MNDNSFIGTIAFIILFFIALTILTLGFDYVPAGNIGVTDNLGVIGDMPWGPGIKWTGILTSTKDFTTRIQLKEYESGGASKDLQIVNAKVALNFKVNPQKTPEIYKTIGANYQDIIISPIVQEAVKSSTAKYTAEQLIKERTAVKNDITNYIINKLESRGLQVTEVAITNFDFSVDFNKAIEEKQVAEQRALTAENKFKEMEWTSKSMILQKEVLEIKKLDLQKEWIDKWDGKLPLVMTGSNSNSDNSNMLMQFNLKDFMAGNVTR